MKVVHRGYGPTERQIGHVYKGWRIVKRRKISKIKAELFYDGKRWEYLGERVRY